MAQIIDARVKQKTGTEADFAGFTMLEGEVAFIQTSPNGDVFQMKVCPKGGGPRNFDDLPYFPLTPGSAQKADTSTVFPSGVPGLYIPTEDGTYEGETVDLSVGYVQLIWDGSTMTKVEFPINLSGYATKAEAVLNSDLDKSPGKNKFNKNNLLSNTQVNSSGSLVSGTNYYVYQVLSGLTADSYVLSGISSSSPSKYLAWLDSNGSPTGSVVQLNGGGDFVLTKPQSATGIRFTCRVNGEAATVLDTIQLEEGTEKTPYEPYAEYITSLSGDLFRDETALSADSLRLSDTANKMNSPVLLKTGNYMSSSGTETPNSNYFYVRIKVDAIKTVNVSSDYLALTSNQNSYGARYVCFRDANLDPISGIDAWTKSFVTPAGTEYVDISGHVRALATYNVTVVDRVATLAGSEVGETAGFRWQAIGDSTTYGADLADPPTERWTTLLGAALGVHIVNLGQPGARAEEITARIGGVLPKVRVQGGTIPQSSYVGLDFLDINPLRVDSQVGNLDAALLLRDGTVVRGNLTTNAFRQNDQVSDISVGDSIVDVLSMTGKSAWDAFTFIGMGINNESLVVGGTQTIDQVKNWYVAATSCYSNFVVWGLLDRGLGEAPGTPVGDFIVEMEAFLEQTYGTRYIKLRQYLSSERALEDAVLFVPGFTPTTDDLDCVAAGVTPPSFRAPNSSVHLNALGNQLQALFFEKWLNYYVL